jgi:ketosteroid isomerase-like protein
MSDTQVEQDNKAIISRAFDAWAAGTGGVFDLLADDATWTIVGTTPVSGTYTSRQEFLDVVIGPFGARMATPLVPTVHALYADGDTVIAYFEASGTARDGKPYFNTYTWYLTMDGGRVAKAVAFFDTVEFSDFWTRVSPA